MVKAEYCYPSLVATGATSVPTDRPHGRGTPSRTCAAQLGCVGSVCCGVDGSRHPGCQYIFTRWPPKRACRVPGRRNSATDRPDSLPWTRSGRAGCVVAMGPVCFGVGGAWHPLGRLLKSKRGFCRESVKKCVQSGPWGKQTGPSGLRRRGLVGLGAQRAGDLTLTRLGGGGRRPCAVFACSMQYAGVNKSHL